MATIAKNESIKPILKELERVNMYLRKLLLIIPEESLKEYKNSSQIKKSYLRATKLFSPSEKCLS